MSPTRWTPCGDLTVACCVRDGSLQSEDLEVKEEEILRNTADRLGDLLPGMKWRMAKLDTSQEANDQLMDRESSVFGSAIGQG